MRVDASMTCGPGDTMGTFLVPNNQNNRKYDFGSTKQNIKLVSSNQITFVITLEKNPVGI